MGCVHVECSFRFLISVCFYITCLRSCAYFYTLRPPSTSRRHRDRLLIPHNEDLRKPQHVDCRLCGPNDPSCGLIPFPLFAFVNCKPEEAAVTIRRASLSDLSCLDDIELLSVRQLKEILARNFVNFTGCCEKWELMERVRRLYQEQQRLRGKSKHKDEPNKGGIKPCLLE